MLPDSAMLLCDSVALSDGRHTMAACAGAAESGGADQTDHMRRSEFVNIALVAVAIILTSALRGWRQNPRTYILISNFDGRAVTGAAVPAADDGLACGAGASGIDWSVVALLIGAPCGLRGGKGGAALSPGLVDVGALGDAVAGFLNAMVCVAGVALDLACAAAGCRGWSGACKYQQLRCFARSGRKYQ
jgi:hypothetical protein